MLEAKQVIVMRTDLGMRKGKKEGSRAPGKTGKGKGQAGRETQKTGLAAKAKSRGTPEEG